MKKHYVLALCSIIGALAIAGCTTKGGGKKKSSITSVSLNAVSKELDVGQSFECTATVEGTGNFDDSVEWSTLSSGILTISGTGKTITATALKAGETKLVATSIQDKTKTASVNVKVNEYIPPVVPTITGVSLNETSPKTIEIGSSFSLTATVSGTGDYNKNVNWSVSEQGVITFGTGNTISVIGSSGGTVTLTATAAGDSSKSASLVVTVNDPTPVSKINRVTLSEESKTLLVGESFDLLATVEGTGDFNPNVLWSDNNDGVVTYGAGNQVRVVAAKAGTVKLTAKSVQDSSKSRYCNIVVEDIPAVTGVTLNVGSSLVMDVGESKQITATVSGTGSFNQNVTWSLSGSAVSKSDNLNKTALKANTVGTATLRATSVGDPSFYAETTITVQGDFDLDHPMTYSKVTSKNDLVIGEYYIVVSKTTDDALGVEEQSNGHPKAISILKEDNLAKKVVGTEVQVVKLEEGATTDSYALRYKNKGGNNGKYFAVDQSKKNEITSKSSLDRESSWDISISSESTLIRSIDQYVFDKYAEYAYISRNGSSSIYGAYRSAAVTLDVELYKYFSGKEYLSFDCGEDINLSINNSKNVLTEVHGFNPDSFSWSSNNPSVATVSGTGPEAIITAGSNSGDAIITCSATEGSLTVTGMINVHVLQYVYNTIDEGKYAFTSESHYCNPQNAAKDAENFDPNDLSHYFDVVKAYEGDNTFYVKANNNYLAKDPSRARVQLTTTPTIWTVERNTTVGFKTTINSKTYTFKYEKGVSNPWICVEGSANTPVFAQPTFKEMNVNSSGLVQKTFNYDEAFNSKGLVVNAICNSSLGEQSYAIALADINWPTLYVDGTITGHVNFLGEVRDVVVSGLTITHYEYVDLRIDASEGQIDYQVGESTNIDGVNVYQHFEDSKTSLTKDVEIVDRENIQISPAVIAATTSEITLTYKGISNSYAIHTPEVVRFVQADSITKGDKIVIAGYRDKETVKVEVGPDGLNAQEFTNLPHGNAIFEVCYNTSYPYYVFKLVEEYGVPVTTNKYLAQNGTKTGIASSITDLATWEIGSREYPDEFYFTNKETGSPLGINQKSPTPKLTTDIDATRDDCLIIYRLIA